MKIIHKIYEKYIIKMGLAKIGKNSLIYYPTNLRLKKNIYIGENTTILHGSRLSSYEDLVNKSSRIIIGDNCYIAYNFSALAGDDIIIESNVLIASNVLVSSENHGINPESNIPYMNQDLITKPVIIKEGAWVGEKAIILPGVIIGKKSVIAAGSVVTKSIDNYCIAAGIPAKVIKKYNFSKHKWERVEN